MPPPNVAQATPVNNFMPFLSTVTVTSSGSGVVIVENATSSHTAIQLNGAASRAPRLRLARTRWPALLRLSWTSFIRGRIERHVLCDLPTGTGDLYVSGVPKIGSFGKARAASLFNTHAPPPRSPRTLIRATPLNPRSKLTCSVMCYNNA